MTGPSYFLHALRRRWKEALLCFVLVVGVAVAWTFLRNDEYSSVAEIQVNPYGASDQGARQAGLIMQYDPESSIRSLASLAESNAILKSVRDQAGGSLRDLDRQITASPKSQSTLLAIRAQTDAPERSQQLAQATVRSLQELVTQRRDQKSSRLLATLIAKEQEYRAQGLPVTEVRESIADLLALRVGPEPLTSLYLPASFPYQADGPSRGLVIGIGVLAGLLLAFLLALFLEGRAERERERKWEIWPR